MTLVGNRLRLLSGNNPRLVTLVLCDLPPYLCSLFVLFLFYFCCGQIHGAVFKRREEINIRKLTLFACPANYLRFT
jgi:hypothetical protein